MKLGIFCLACWGKTRHEIRNVHSCLGSSSRDQCSSPGRTNIMQDLQFLLTSQSSICCLPKAKQEEYLSVCRRQSKSSSDLLFMAKINVMMKLRWQRTALSSNDAEYIGTLHYM